MPNEDDVLINFVGDVSGLAPVDDALEAIILQSGQVGEAWKKTSTAIENQNKNNVAGTNKLAKSIQDLATATKSMDKAVIGGAYKEYLKQIQTQLGLTNKELVTYVQNARKAAQEAIFSAGTDEEIDQLTLSIQAMNEQLAVLGAAEDEAGGKTQSLRARIREAKEELVAMAEAGLQGTPAFQALQNKAGELDDQMRDLNATIKNTGSDTKNIEGLVGIATGVAGGFAVAQGAMALFGDQNEEVQKALLKVNAAMAILQGLQQIEQVIQKETAASLLLTNLFYKQKAAVIEENVVATEGLAVAEGEQAVATDAATVSQIALNTAMELNPVALVVAAVVALTAALGYFALSNDKAEQSQRDLDAALKFGQENLEAYLHGLELATAKQIALAKERGATGEEVAKLEGSAGNARLQLLQNQINAYDASIKKAQDADEAVGESYQKLTDKKKDLEDQLQNELNSLQVKGIEYRKTLADGELKAFITEQEAKVLATRSGSVAEKGAQLQELKNTQADRIKIAQEGAATIAEANAAATKIIAEDARTKTDTLLAIYAYALKSETAFSEADVAKRKTDLIKNQTDTIASINALTDAEIAAIKRRTNEQLKSNPNLSPGEVAKITAEANLQILELERQKEAALLETRKAGINAALILAQKGTDDEYKLKVAAINNEQQLELQATQLTAAQVNEINAKAQKAKEDALRSFNEQQIQNQISIDSASLDQFGLTESQKLGFTLKRLDEQRALEISQADKNQSKILEINAKYDAQAREARKASINAQLDDTLKSLEVFSEQSRAANQKILDSTGTSNQSKIKALQELQDFEDQKFEIQHKALTDQVEENLLTAHEFDLAYQDLVNKRADSEIETQKRVTALYLQEIEKRTASIQSTFAIFQKGLTETLGNTGLSTAITEFQNFGATVQDIMAKVKLGTISGIEGFKAMAGAAIGAMQTVVNQIFADNTAARQQALQDTISALEDQKAKELDNKNLTEEQKAEIDKKYKEKEKQEKIKAFQADKEAKRSQAVINGLLAVTNALATAPTIIAGIILAAVVAASTAIQVAKINATPVPKFRHGKVGIEGPGSTTSDSIPAMISKGESVINADATAKWKDALEAINTNKFEHYITNKLADFVFPQVPDNIKPSGGGHIDYDRLSSAIAEKMKGIIPASKQIDFTIDQNGIHTIVKEGNSRTEYKNKRYSTN